jgi:hypothetical protein
LNKDALDSLCVGVQGGFESLNVLELVSTPQSLIGCENLMKLAKTRAYFGKGINVSFY